MSTTQPIKDTDELTRFKNYYKREKPNTRNYTLIIIGLNSALRISDILHLTYGDVYDFERHRWKTHITVREQKTGKTNCIYMNQEILNALERHAAYTVPEKELWLFASQMQNRQPLSRFQAYRLIREAASFAGLGPNISCHSLRKTFGYHAWKQGTPPALLMDIYNHSAYGITKKYLCIDQDDKDDVFKKIQL